MVDTSALTLGKTTTYDVTIRLCKQCGCRVGSTELCSYGCSMDGDKHEARDVISVTYERTDVVKELA